MANKNLDRETVDRIDNLEKMLLRAGSLIQHLQEMNYAARLEDAGLWNVNGSTEQQIDAFFLDCKANTGIEF